MAKIWKTSRAIARGSSKKEIFLRWNHKFHEEVDEGKWKREGEPAPSYNKTLKRWLKSGRSEKSFIMLGTQRALEVLEGKRK